MNKLIYTISLLTILSSFSLAQGITDTIPNEIKNSQKYLFYLHGGIVQEQGVNAVSPLYGPYKYLEILDTLRSHNYQVISEVRPKGTVETEYAKKVAGQIDDLIDDGVPSKNIIVVGASLGAYITIEVAKICEKPGINYVVIGLCSEYALDLFWPYRDNLCGKFLSIYENSDEKGSCYKILENKNCKTGYKEIELHMGMGHGFLYKPYSDWVDPLVNWINGNDL